MTGRKKMGAPLRFSAPTGNETRDRIIALRRALGLSQAQLAEKCGAAQSTVADWERGFRNPSGSALVIIGQLEKKAAKRKGDPT